MDSPQHNEKQFFADYSKVSGKLGAYIRQLLPTRYDADEVLQETSIVLWNKYEQFEQGSNFFAWACKIAYFETLKYRRSKARDRHVFSEELLKQLADKAEEVAEDHEKRKQALDRCFGQLSNKYQELLVSVYFKNAKIKDVAAVAQMKPKAMYKLLTRVRGKLRECIES